LPTVDVLEPLSRFAPRLVGLTREARVPLFVTVGFSLSLLAVPRFQEKFPTAYRFMPLVFLLWVAIALFL
jgi:hypothetical protein